MAYPSRKKNIFISYRVHDTAGETGRLVDSLKQYFYEDQIFMDIEKLQPGVDFTKVIANSLESCDVLLAVIGPNWLGPANAAGKTRIMLDDDWVRLELTTALKRNIVVIPVLVDGGSLPQEADLPPDLAPLVKRQSHEISNKRWKYDTDSLAVLLHKLGIPIKNDRGKKEEGRKGMSVLKIVGIAAGIFFILIILIIAANTDNQQTLNNDVNSATSLSKPENVTEPVQQPVETVYPIAGTWVQTANQFFLIITQDGQDLEVTSYSPQGQSTGQGTGRIKGNQVQFKLSITNFGFIAVQATLVNTNQMDGNMSITQNGSTLSEVMTLVKNQ
ncbi:MAG TPA: toll/interleukin-1 receptor domain-containing protein [Flavitalea sp.]|nr:toll/interleukin-1 receptor domain-containing protein [Flavitalea sp.]